MKATDFSVAFYVYVLQSGAISRLFTFFMRFFAIFVIADYNNSKKQGKFALFLIFSLINQYNRLARFHTPKQFRYVQDFHLDILHCYVTERY